MTDITMDDLLAVIRQQAVAFAEERLLRVAAERVVEEQRAKLIELASQSPVELPAAPTEGPP